MKKRLKPYYGIVNGREELLVSLMNFRDTYSTEIKKHPILTSRYVRTDKDGNNHSAGTPRSAWVAVLGIPTIGTDGAKMRCAFRYESLVAALSALKWEADEDETQETHPCDELEQLADKTEDDNDQGEAVLYSVDSVQTLLLQMIDQKLDCIIKELGVNFVLDETKLLKLQELKN